MKYFFTLCLLSLSILLLNCSGDDDGPNLPDYAGIPCNSLSMNYDGEDWASETLESNFSTFTQSHSQRAFRDGKGPIFLLSTLAPGTYLLGEDLEQTPTLTFVDPDDPGNYTSLNTLASGQLEIVELDEENLTISGRFNAMLIGPNGDFKEVKDGLFHKMPYTEK